jgi:hypothetical protein
MVYALTGDLAEAQDVARDAYAPAWVPGRFRFDSSMHQEAQRGIKFHDASDEGHDESFVYRVQQLPGTDYFLVIVRVGDRVTVLSVGKELSPGTARDLAEKAARRLVP